MQCFNKYFCQTSRFDSVDPATSYSSSYTTKERKGVIGPSFILIGPAFFKTRDDSKTSLFNILINLTKAPRFIHNKHSSINYELSQACFLLLLCYCNVWPCTIHAWSTSTSKYRSLSFRQHLVRGFLFLCLPRQQLFTAGVFGSCSCLI
jgi:hypothetical protein